MNDDVPLTAKLLNGIFRLLGAKRFAMPSLFVRHERDSGSLYGLRDDEGGLSFLANRLAVGCINGCSVVAIDFDGMPPKSSGAGSVDRCIPTELRWSPLTQPVHVQNCNYVA